MAIDGDILDETQLRFVGIALPLRLSLTLIIG